jgi:microcystin-dependent protein
MADPFLAEIRIFPFNFAPRGWAFCDGQLMPLSQNTALFALLGTTYGGDGKSTFALPDLQGRVPMQPGQGQGLSPRDLGESSGAETITLLTSEMPLHSHNLVVSEGDGLERFPGGQLLATGIGVGQYGPTSTNTTLSPQALAPAGGSLPHNNMQPYLTLYFNIALQGIFPQRP